MERLADRLRLTRKALASLGRALAERPTDIVRDSAIKRFEYSFDLSWKLLSRYLVQGEGIEVASPKASFREALRVGILSESEARNAVAMTDDRNLTAHNYDEQLARQIYRRIRGHYRLLEVLVARIGERIKA